MKFTLALAALAGYAAAYPSVLKHVIDGRDIGFAEVEARASSEKPFKCPTPKTGGSAAVTASQARGNCGAGLGCTIFDAEEQLVSTSGDHEYIKPGPSDIRGPSPGLNAAANHNYLPRSGYVDTASTISGLAAAYGMGADISAALAALSIGQFGDAVSGTWSIGGPVPSPPSVTPPNTGVNTGISYSHNNYESDGSQTRGDAYLHGGDAHSVVVSRFTEVYLTRLVAGHGATPGNTRQFGYTLDSFSQDYICKSAQSIAQNPQYVSGPLAGLIVAPAAYNFIINFMSNHSATNTNGWLSPEVYKSFFAITGNYPNFKWLPGQERIPDNWYRRPSTQPYSGAILIADLLSAFAAYPETARLGCNNGKVNTYVQGDVTFAISAFGTGVLGDIINEGGLGQLPPNCPGALYQP